MGEVEHIHITAVAGTPAEPEKRGPGPPGRGGGGARFFGAPEPGPGGDLTLIAAESLERLAAEHGIWLEPGESRRQVTTRGVDVNALVGRRFRVGSVEAVGTELCEPCSHLAKLTERGVLRGLVHRGGIN